MYSASSADMLFAASWAIIKSKTPSISNLQNKWRCCQAMIDREYEVQITELGDIAHKSHSFHPGSVLTHDFIACAQVVLSSERWHRSYELTYYTRS